MSQIKLFLNHFKNSRASVNNLGCLLIVFLVLLCSGNGFVLFVFPSKIRIFLYVIIILILSFLSVLPLKPKEILFNLKKKRFGKVSIPFAFTILFLIFVLISFIFNENRLANINNYLDICFVVVASLLLSSRISYKIIAKSFNSILLIFSISSLFLYLMVCIGKYGFGSSFFVSGSYRYDNYGFLNLFYNEMMHGTGGAPRFCSIFWEPGVYASFLLIALTNEILFKKTSAFNILFFSVCMIFTKSTASLVLYPFLVILFISNIIKNNRARCILLSVSFLSITVFLGLLLFYPNLLIKALPSLFEKFSGSVSLTSRMNSPYYYFLTYSNNIKTIFFGMGGVSANLYYYSIAPSQLIDSGTSTSAYLMASYGSLGAFFTILPLIGIFFNKKWNLPTKISLSILLLFIFNKENHASVLFSIAIVYYLMSIIPKLKLFKRKTNVFFSFSKYRSIEEILFAETDRGVLGRNAFGSLLIKVLALIVSVLTIPVYTAFFSNTHNLDVWLVIYSVLSWILLFDFGFGNGMKNKLIYMFTNKDYRSVRSIISNTYVPTIFISVFIFLIVVPLCLFSNVNVVFGDSNLMIEPSELKTALIIITLSICLQFVLRNISFIYQSQNRNVLGSSFSLMSSSAFVFTLFIIKNIDGPKFIYIAIAYLLSINLPLVVFNIVFFLKNPNLIPSFREYSFKKCKEVMSLGIQYFIVQLCSLILWSSNSILITQIFDPTSTERFVYYYTCYYKIYSLIVSLITIISTTVWVTAGKAYTTHNNHKIIKLLKLSFLYSTLLSFACLVCSFGLQIIFNIWLGTTPESRIATDFLTILIFASYCMLTLFSETLIVFCNAFARLKKQVIVSIVFASLKIPFLLIFHYLNLLSNFWQIVVLYNSIYSLVMFIVLGLDLWHFLKNEIIKYGIQSSVKKDNLEMGELIVYEIDI